MATQTASVSVSMVSSGSSTPVLKTKASVSESMVSSGTSSNVRKTKASITESMVASMSVGLSSSMMAAIVEAMTSSGSASSLRILKTGVTEGMTIADALGVSATYHVSVTEQMSAGAYLSFNGELYEGWTFEAHEYAGAQTRGLNFNSFCEYQGVYYGCGKDGVYELDGADDQGRNIDALVSTGYIKTFSNRQTKIHESYLMVKNDGTVKVRVIGEGNNIFTYTLAETSEYHHERQVKVGRGLKSVLWRFEFENDQGSDFDVESWKIYPLELNRHV